MTQYNNAINNQFLSSYTGPNKVSKNLCFAGDFSSNPWQLGTSFVSPAGGAYSADGIQVVGNSGSTYTISRVADGPTVAQCGFLVNYCWQLQVTSANASIGASQSLVIQHRIEGFNWAAIAQNYFTVSVWVKAFKPGIYCFNFGSSNGTTNYVSEFTINSSDVWELKTITVSPSPSAGTWNYTNGIGLRVTITLAAGSNFYTTANSWNAAVAVATSSQTNGIDSNSNTFRIALLQVEKGTVATPFEIKSEEETLRACQRYIQKTFPQGTTPAQATGSQLGALQYTAQVAGINANGVFSPCNVTMRTTPTITYYNTNNAGTTWYNATLAANSGASSTISAGCNSIFTSNAQVVGDLVGNSMVIHCVKSAVL